MVEPGDIVIARFAGATLTKVRPTVVVSSAEYHEARPDCVLGLITTNLTTATTAFDCVLSDWAEAGLDRPSAFRAYLGMAITRNLIRVGRLSERDLIAVRSCLSDVFVK